MVLFPKGMPQKFYRCHTGRVWNVTKRAIIDVPVMSGMLPNVLSPIVLVMSRMSPNVLSLIVPIVSRMSPNMLWAPQSIDSLVP